MDQTNKLGAARPVSWIVIRLSAAACPAADTMGDAASFFLTNNRFPWKKLMALFQGIFIEPCFSSLSHEQISVLVNRATQDDPNYCGADFFRYFIIGCPSGATAGQLLNALSGEPDVELAYLQNTPLSLPSVSGQGVARQQSFQDPAPAGIDVKHARQLKGGAGSGGVRFIDIEQGWLTVHESISGSITPVSGISHYDQEDHGIAVLGIIVMQHKTSGLTGIAPKVRADTVSEWRTPFLYNTADAILAAITLLQPGDVLLIEVQSEDPYEPGNYWPIETQEAVWQAIRLGSALGIIVIEPAGNRNFCATMGDNLDHYAGSGGICLNCTDPNFTDSGAILVAASTIAFPYQRKDFSNYGTRIDCFAHGEHIFTTGLHPRSSGCVINGYTHRFGGTSAASAIIAGAAILVQSVLLANTGRVCSPGEMRKLLGHPHNCTPSANGRTTDGIGAMPDLKKIIDVLLPQNENYSGKLSATES